MVINHMARYEYETDENGQVIKCDSCGYPAPLSEFTMSTVGLLRGQKAMLCEICAKTAIGQAYEFPHQYEGQDATMRAVGYVANRILDEIRKSR